MAGDPTTERRREATGDDLRRLLKRLDADPNRAWQLYDSLRRRLVTLFEHDGHFDAAELAEEVLDRIAKKSDSEQIDSVVEFAFGVARNLRRETSRKTSARVPIHDLDDLEERNSVESHPEDAIVGKIDSGRRLQCFLRCMRGMAALDRRLLLKYYPVDHHALDQRRQDLASALGTNIGALRTKVMRLKDKLEDCLEECCSRIASSSK